MLGILLCNLVQKKTRQEYRSKILPRSSVWARTFITTGCINKYFKNFNAMVGFPIYLISAWKRNPVP